MGAEPHTIDITIANSDDAVKAFGGLVNAMINTPAAPALERQRADPSPGDADTAMTDDELKEQVTTLADAYRRERASFIFCAECRCGPHGATGRCGCCEDCHRNGTDCRCGCPPRGVLLTARQLREMRKDLEGRDHNSGAPYWTERVGALLDHIELLTNPKLPGM